jgi:peptidoglycan glycosyltransferase
LTLSAALQVQAQEALTDLAGAVILVDATSGAIRVLASSPTFPPGHLDDVWDELTQDPSAPLVNRATQGLYQPGSVLQTIVVAEGLIEGAIQLSAPEARPTATVRTADTSVGCNPGTEAPTTLGESYAAACPAPVAAIGELVGAVGLTKAVARWELAAPPSLELPTEAADWRLDETEGSQALTAEAIGQGELTVSPLHMALVGATLANDGLMPSPHLVYRVQDNEGKWRETVRDEESRQVLPSSLAEALVAEWPTGGSGDGIPGYWGTAVAGEGQHPHAWFIGINPVSRTSGEGPHAIAVLVEHAQDPQVAFSIGTALLEAATGP